MNHPIPPDPVDLLQTLIRFDTTNPPGNEAACVAHIDRLLQAAGVRTTILARDEGRPNLVARLPGRGTAPPLLLYGHVDVVPTTGQEWRHPPFSGRIIDGTLWGRGALDMKGGIAMMVTAFLRAQHEDLDLPGDLVLAVLSDEEVDGEYGAKYVVEHHPDLFRGIRYAIGEGGGYTTFIAGRKFYPIMVAEKQVCSLQATVRGPAGHGSVPLRGGAMAKLANVLHTLDRRRTPIHVTPIVRRTVETMSRALPFPLGLALRLTLNPVLSDPLLDRIGVEGEALSPLLRNTASPTIVQGGNKINVIPSEVTLELDGRLLPGFTPQDLLDELADLLGDEVEWEVTRYDPGPPASDMAGYEALAHVLRTADPAGTPVPYLLSGVTDGRYFGQLGIQTYGFLPLDLPEGLIATIHAADERVPVEAIRSGTDVLYQAMQHLNTLGHRT
jgi:acetylornithine deacetylase/succinyl-diaminopimelate desuccinylase-like protein